ncbi:hypothetical protein PPYR_11247 [Photinus pyralis]|uniref:Protein TsetseEP domain-containing protein n=1 Tax=Photinus pyralis TaxID=7054 RepID=A0A5N4AAX3_PHOPY|nr:uncharacterized protein LOC116176480 [Photinus pyralis]KAB0794408.1 hypothetical protein PPYR_11247 [Photinus pyralis]
MQLLALIIGIFSLHCAFGAQCNKPEKEIMAQCMQIIHPEHGELLGNTVNLPQQYLQQIYTLLKDVRREITNEQFTTTTKKHCLDNLRTRVDDISKSYMTRVITVDSNVKQRFIDTNTALGSALVKASQCEENHDVSCEVIQSCCTNVKNELYAQKSISSGSVTNFLVEFTTQFSKECDSILSSIRNLQADLNSCKTGVTERKKSRIEAVMLDKTLKSQASTSVMTSNLLVSCSILFVVFRAMY